MKYPWLKPAVFWGSLVPLAAIGVDAFTGGLGPEPVAEALNRLGLLALVFLIASLVCTPLNVWMRWAWPVRLRRMLGLYAFFYASLHFLTYLVVDQGLAIAAIALDIVKRPFILAGLTALLLLIPLAVTSTARSVKRLGYARWKALHRLVYVAAVLGVVHFFLRVKIDTTEPVIYGIVLCLLFLARLVPTARSRARRGHAWSPG